MCGVLQMRSSCVRQLLHGGVLDSEGKNPIAVREAWEHVVADEASRGIMGVGRSRGQKEVLMGERGLRDLVVAYGNGDGSVFLALQEVVEEVARAEALAPDAHEKLSHVVDNVMSQLRHVDASELPDDDAVRHRITEEVSHWLCRCSLTEAVWRMRRGDTQAEWEALRGVDRIVQKVARRLTSVEGNWSADDHSEGALDHVLKKLKSNAFDESLCPKEAALTKWIRTTAERYIRGQARRWKGVGIVTGDEEMQDSLLPEFADPSPAREKPNHLQALVFRQIAGEFAVIQRAVAKRLHGVGRTVDWAAIYWWFCREELYTALRRQGKRAADWHSVLECVEEWCSWDDDVQALRFRDGWPCIGDLWRELRPSLEARANLTADMIVDAARALQPDVPITGDQLYQWRRRLKKELDRLDQEGFLDTIEVAPDAVVLWRRLMLRSDETIAQPEDREAEQTG